MPKIWIFLLILSVGAFGQTSADLSAKYHHVIAYEVRPNVLMTARFAPDTQVCEMTLEKRQTTDAGIVFGDTFSDTEVRSLMDDLVPENDRGRDLTRALNETITGGFMTTEYTYENVLIRVQGIIRPAGAAGYKVITITWPKRACGQVKEIAH